MYLNINLFDRLLFNDELNRFFTNSYVSVKVSLRGGGNQCHTDGNRTTILQAVAVSIFSVSAKYSC